MRGLDKDCDSTIDLHEFASRFDPVFTRLNAKQDVRQINIYVRSDLIPFDTKNLDRKDLDRKDLLEIFFCQCSQLRKEHKTSTAYCMLPTITFPPITVK